MDRLVVKAGFFFANNLLRMLKRTSERFVVKEERLIIKVIILMSREYSLLISFRFNAMMHVKGDQLALTLSCARTGTLS